MKIENQVASLELSKKLKELGYPQEGVFMRVESYGRTEIWGTTNIGQYPPYSMLCVAPTVAELGEWLPKKVPCGKSFNGTPKLHISKHFREDLWVVDYSREEARVPITDKTEANARAAMLIWLVENEYVSFKDKE